MIFGSSLDSHFPTIRTATIGKRTRDTVDVTFANRDGSVDHLRFHNHPERHIIAFDEIDGDAEVSAEITFQPGRTAGTTWVHSRLHADVHGFASMFVDGAELRARRQQQVREDLERLQAYFAK